MEWRYQDLETVPCDFCKSMSVRHIFKRNDGLNIVECSECGLCFISPRPVPDLIYRLYDKNYFKKESSSSDSGFPDYLSSSSQYSMLKSSKQRLEVFRETTGVQPEKCLEIGCATGEFCHVLSQAGSQVSGLDLSEFAIAEAEEYPDSDFRVGGIEISGDNEYFDAIFAFELIEHVLSPDLFMKKAKYHLKKNGFLVLTTPNYECGKNIGLEKWKGAAKSFEHLYFFTPAILSLYAEKYKLSVVKWFTGGGNGLTVAPNKNKQTILRFFKKITEKAQLLDFFRSIRDKLYKEGHGYQDYGYQHNLFMIFQADRY